MSTKPDENGARQGYLLLADISGYTAFLTGTELEHAQAIIRELTTLIRERLAPPMRFLKLEGDAVFCYADAAALRDGERLVELIEACYFDFSNRLLDMTRATTCRCAACDGPQAYAFLTEACLKRMPPSFSLPAHSEAYESFSETTGGVHDLGPVLNAMRAARREYITSEEADFEYVIDVPAPPQVAWQY